jgi:hypothetical protein
MVCKAIYGEPKKGDILLFSSYMTVHDFWTAPRLLKAARVLLCD